MKLDYLRFLELEVFTRFGARLEPSMELAIHRGCLLREILKQDRLSPLPVLFQMAWMVAFNDGLFDDRDPDEIPALLAAIEGPVLRASPGLNRPREEWSVMVARLLEEHSQDTET
jgi:F-type H+-transporting ATPase subunit alpha